MLFESSEKHYRIVNSTQHNIEVEDFSYKMSRLLCSTTHHAAVYNNVHTIYLFGWTVIDFYSKQIHTVTVQEQLFRI